MPFIFNIKLRCVLLLIMLLYKEEMPEVRCHCVPSNHHPDKANLGNADNKEMLSISRKSKNCFVPTASEDNITRNVSSNLRRSVKSILILSE